MLQNIFSDVVETEEELSLMIGLPSELAKRKVITFLDKHCVDYISKSPFLVLSTSDQYGCDVSPRGDMPGFVQVLDKQHLVIPERPGNKRLDSLRNILANPKVGLLFFIPGLGETLRVNGKATIVKDEKLLEKMEVNGHRPLIGIGVEVEECFLHCAKAFIRSGLWEPSSWAETEKLPSPAKILSEHSKLPGVAVNTIHKNLQDSYNNRLY
ncbi:pyridoxamine 5'-phosphate oxidase family protein [Bacillus sp. FJAT-45350]|uniref:pyridoxamine 5'-phosphate oxidase family protein n=1 Tax=Bacillus sp. FJAT-45350 TaxID=2011014 RepID=UPI00359CA2ED